MSQSYPPYSPPPGGQGPQPPGGQPPQGGQGWPPSGGQPPGGPGWPPQGGQGWPPQQQPSSAGKIVLYLFVGLGVSGLLCCGLCCGTGYWAVQDEHKKVAGEVMAEYAGHPDVVEQLGGLDRVTPNFWASISDDEYDVVLDVRGPKGTGTIRVSTIFGTVYEAVLRTSAGEWQLEEEEDDDWMPTLPDDTPAEDEREA